MNTRIHLYGKKYRKEKTIYAHVSKQFMKYEKIVHSFIEDQPYI